MTEIYLSDTQVAARYRVHRGTIRRWERTDPNFPKSIKLSAGCTRWKLAELLTWEGTKAASG